MNSVLEDKQAVAVQSGIAESTSVDGKKFCKTANHADFASSCLLYTSPSPRDVEESRMPSSA